ncbi:unnamed protein product [Soboliphyme baturini]|uniref:RRP7 domain-containing protein n=1 Tax=Soboliphyme baturini TaxID=241478 RepID=A0A183IPR3_9BILA|nr:unnamed protein product [Soboliphyme baturini]
MVGKSSIAGEQQKQLKNQEIDSFKILRLKVSSDSTAYHWMYLKEHSTRVQHESKPQKRTLMVIAVPPFLNRASIQELFEPFGVVEKVFLQKAPSATAPEVPSSANEELSSVDASLTFCLSFPLRLKSRDYFKGYRVAYVVFKEESSVKATMDHSEKHSIVMKKLPPNGVESNGFDEPKASIASAERKHLLSEWATLYHLDIPDVQELQSVIKATIDEYDEKKKLEKEERKAKRGIPDEEGWITVTREGVSVDFRSTLLTFEYR